MLYKLALVDDEDWILDGLQNAIEWDKIGFQIAGAFTNGRDALEALLENPPDAILTDIKMPFMDGLSLSRLVHQEFPDMKIIIISGYDDFEYARGAILVGAEQYLLKPITRAAMQKVLAELKTKIETEREQKTYQEKFQSEVREYEQFSRTDFFVKVFEGRMPVQDIYEEASKLSLKINAPCYNILLFNLQEKRIGEDRGVESEGFARKREELLHYFIRYPENLVFRWNVNTYGVLIKGSPEQMQELGARCLENVERICHPAEEFLDWYVALGEPVERLSLLAECYSNVNHFFACRFLRPQMHVFTGETVGRSMPEKEEGGRIRDIDPAKMEGELIRDFLLQGARDEIADFVENYLLAVGEALQSAMFRNYLTLHIYFTAVSCVESLGCDKEELLQLLDDEGLAPEGPYDVDALPDYLRKLIEKAMELRDRESDNQSRRILKKALSYIEENYSQETLSLNSVAGEVNVSANYFSAIFSQAMQVTFVEYVTGRRMDKAKKLLRQTQMHTGEIAMEVGYKDPHYFSFVFKKTQGCTPREYRSGAKY